MYRFCNKLSLKEATELRYGMDFRKPQFRRETFLRFYEFHLKHNAHPGCVYSILPFLFRKFDMDWEQRLWFCFLNGNTQNAITSYVIYKAFPDLKSLDLEKFEAWYMWWYPNLQFDTDRRHHKSVLVEAVRRYKELIKRFQNHQFHYFMDRAIMEKPFRELFKKLKEEFYSFGRLSTFSFMEYLRLAGLPIECDDLLLEDIDGSRSHRNGLCKVLGRDDLDWHDSNPGFDGKYSPELIEWLKEEARQLLAEAHLRFGHIYRDVNYFTLESALCTYKSWHRPNRRYPGCYLDMFRNRMDFYVARLAGKQPDVLDVFNEWRDTVPRHLRTELNPGDVGLKPEKQNHYLLTGQPVMMDREWSCFKNSYNDKVNATKELF